MKYSIIIIMLSSIILNSCTRIIKGIGYFFWQGNIELKQTPEEKMYTSLFANYVFLTSKYESYILYAYNQACDANHQLTIPKLTKPCENSFLVQLTSKGISAKDIINILHRQYLLTGNQNINIVTFNKIPEELRHLLKKNLFKVEEIKSSTDLSASYNVKQISSEYLYNNTHSQFLHNKKKLSETYTDSILQITEKTSYQYRIWLPEEIVLNRRYSKVSD